MGTRNTASFVTKSEEGRWTVHTYLVSTPELRVKYLKEMMSYGTIYDDMHINSFEKPVDAVERATDLLWGWIKQGVLKKSHLKEILRAVGEK